MKKLFTLFALLMMMVAGAKAATETFSMATKWTSTSVTQNGITVAFSDVIGNAQKGYFKFTKGNTMTISSTVGNITALSFTSDSEKYGKANGTSVNTGTLTGAGTASISWSGDASEIVFTNDASKGGDWRVASITVTYSSGPATAPTITTQPQNFSFTIGDATYPTMSVTATASAGELKYEWFMEVKGVTGSTGIEKAELDLTAFIGNVISLYGKEAAGEYKCFCKVTDDNATVDSKVATLTIIDPDAKAPADPTFSVADGAEIEAGSRITITSDEDATIYYRWSGKNNATWADKAAFIDGRTAYTGSAETSSSTTGDRYLYAQAFRGNEESARVMLHVVVKAATAVDAVAETKADKAAPAKVIKDGKLFIGNYNVAGQQVK